MACELMQAMPAVGYDTVMNFTWAELKAWHSSAVEVWKKIKGAH